MSILTTAATALAATLIGAYAIGQFTSRSINTEITIDAPAEAVWSELADTDAHSEWNPFIRSFSGVLEVGNRLEVTVQPEGKSPMSFTPTVLVSEEARELRWVGRLGFQGIFDGEHFFILEANDNGTTTFRHGERFSGMLAYALFPLIGADTAKGFEAMNRALKERVEAGA